MTEELSFELAMKRLESIVKQMEEGEVALDTSMKLYEEGMRLCAYLNKLLDKAEQKVSIVSRQNGTIEERPFEIGQVII